MIFAGREIRTDYPKLGGWLGDVIGGYRDRDMNRSAIALVEIVKAFEASEQRILALEAALRPFAHPDLCAALGGNVQGDESIIFGRGTAIIKLGDCRNAHALLHDKEKVIAGTLRMGPNGDVV